MAAYPRMPLVSVLCKAQDPWVEFSESRTRVGFPVFVPDRRAATYRPKGQATERGGLRLVELGSVTRSASVTLALFWRETSQGCAKKETLH